MRDAGFDREAQGLRVHIGEHEDLPIARILGHADDQPIGVEAWRERYAVFQFVLSGRAGAGTWRSNHAESSGPWNSFSYSAESESSSRSVFCRIFLTGRWKAARARWIWAARRQP